VLRPHLPHIRSELTSPHGCSGCASIVGERWARAGTPGSEAAAPAPSAGPCGSRGGGSAAAAAFAAAATAPGGQRCSGGQPTLTLTLTLTLTHNLTLTFAVDLNHTMSISKPLVSVRFHTVIMNAVLDVAARCSTSHVHRKHT